MSRKRHSRNPCITLWSGTIAAGGIVDGTWQDDFPAADGVLVRSGTFDATSEFLRGPQYSTSPMCVWVNEYGTRARFGYQIPADAAVGGLYVIVRVIDRGSPGVYDTFEAAASNVPFPDGCDQHPVYGYQYTISDGNLTVFA